MGLVIKGSRVKIHYTGYLKNGKVFDSTDENNPLEFTIGKGAVINGLEKAVMGMDEGSTKSVKIPPEEAYGFHNIDLVSVVEKSKVRGNIDLRVGMKLMARTNEGIIKNVVVSDISDDSITVDANHPLAGEELTFDIKIVDIS